MATKKTTAPANQPDAPRGARLSGYSDRDGTQYPRVLVTGEAPRKGSTLRVHLENGVTYSAKVVATSEAEGGVLEFREIVLNPL